MNNLVKAAFRASSCARQCGITSVILQRGAPVKRDFARSFWHMRCTDGLGAASSSLHQISNTCGCGCGLKGVHTKEYEVIAHVVGEVGSKDASAKKPLGERELVEFLTEEIVAERKAQKIKSIPTEFCGFLVKGDGAEVVLTKKGDNEIISVTFNVNHTVDSEESEAAAGAGAGAGAADKQEFSEMVSRPQFEVDIVRGDTTLSFTCSYLTDHGDDTAEDYSDVFGINEVTMFKGEWNDKVYAVAGDVLDGYLYDLFMNLLEEKGVSNEFAQKLSEFSTAYEHSAYINLLEGLSKFTSGK